MMNKDKYNTELHGHAVVFGASGDIGQEIVVGLVAKGIKKISFAYGRNKEAAETLASELQAEGVTSYFESVNMSDSAAVNAFLEAAVVAQGEEISSMVNAAGISPNKKYQKQTLEKVGGGDDVGAREVYEVNVFGSFIVTRSVAERMKAKGVKGAIVLITSTNGINSYASFSSPYDSSKAAQAMDMRIAAEEYAPYGIRINGVAPGWINTKMNLTIKPKDRKKETAKILSGRWAEPWEIASVVVWLLSSGASYLCGQNIMVDGCYR